MASRILIVDDEKMVRWGLSQALKQAGYVRVDQTDTAAGALEAVGRDMPDLVLLDYQLPDATGLEILPELRQLAPRMPVIMITAHASIGGAVDAVKAGAYDYVSKPFEFEDLVQTVQRGLEAGALRQQVARQREQVLSEFGGLRIVAESPAMKRVVELVRRVGASEAGTILLLGESGAGKGLVARALHFGAGGADVPFMNITCTALTDTLLESELFGHEKGAFTDARTQKRGLFELAEGGTVFLDEIGDLSPGLQGKLLRFLEDKSFRRVGGTRDLRVSVRIVAATNHELKEDVDAGRFRSDLYYRLNVIPITIPPLRDRQEDVLPLARDFIGHFNQEFHKAVQGFDRRAAELIQTYGWPGNVRELRNAVERAVLLTENTLLAPSDLPTEIRDRGTSAKGGDDVFKLPADGVILEELEKSLVSQALERTGGNRSRAAQLLGMNRDQIRYRIEKFKLESHDRRKGRKIRDS